MLGLHACVLALSSAVHGCTCGCVELRCRSFGGPLLPCDAEAVPVFGMHFAGLTTRSLLLLVPQLDEVSDAHDDR